MSALQRSNVGTIISELGTNILKYASSGRILLRAATDRKTRAIVAKMLAVSAFEMISDTFESEAMRGLWAYWCSMFAPATVQASGLYLAAFGSVHRAGIFRPTGGMSGMIGAFERVDRKAHV